jgi:hypothetical protein
MNTVVINVSRQIYKQRDADVKISGSDQQDLQVIDLPGTSPELRELMS